MIKIANSKEHKELTASSKEHERTTYYLDYSFGLITTCCLQEVQHCTKAGLGRRHIKNSGCVQHPKTKLNGR
jgi:hypothetical protein